MPPRGLSLSSSLQAHGLRQGWDARIPPSLRPALRAYLLAYASVVAPRVASLLAGRLARRCRGHDPAEGAPGHDPAGGAPDGPSRTPLLASLRRILRDGHLVHRLPVFCAILIGGTTWLQKPLLRVIGRLADGLSDASQKRLARWLAAFIASCASLPLLQSRAGAGFTRIVAKSDPTEGKGAGVARYAGRTLDLTLFAVTRALDVVVGELWSRRRARRRAAGTWSRFDTAVSRLVDPAVFALSSGLIMWTWIYSPDHLPRAYDKWIAAAAAVDQRLLEALRRCRSGGLRYGEDTGQAPLLQGMCADYGWPLGWGDPARTIPFPCEMVHMGCGPSCELHALSRFRRSFLWAMKTYLPLSMLLVLRSPSRKAAARALLSAARSSAFLGAFITLFYYGVCLARTRAGPHVIGKEVACRQKMDGGLCVGSGCLLCGWSIFVENPSRRKDMGLFVAPRALATLIPRRYPLDKQWRETVAFAASTAIVLTCIQENKRRVRGVLGNILATLMEA